MKAALAPLIKAGMVEKREASVAAALAREDANVAYGKFSPTAELSPVRVVPEHIDAGCSEDSMPLLTT